MDPNTRLDHALFQLTPTRTRCDLVVVGGGVSERLASGLLEPFLAHLKSAKDQISKGGYSITLRPPGGHPHWFTKATLQRFVRFISTPEVLERFVTIEKEIVQIEGSIQSSERSNLVAEAEGSISSADGRVKRSTTSSKMKDESAGTNEDGHEENSRVRLQRVLDNRKAMLCKEQAMAYARALVAGYYPESVDDLICFADAFGASRLREACINFLELCKQKNEDKLWIDEIAAMQAAAQPELPYLRTSGIILAGEDDTSSKLNGIVDASISESTLSHASLDIGQDYSLPTSGQTPSTDGRAQIPMSWPNHLPQYMHNFQGHPFQQMPPYQGYLYPGMQVPSSYYPGNMQWPPNVEDSNIVHDRDKDYHKSSYKKKKKKKKKKKHSQAPEQSEEYSSTASSDSSYESDSDDHSRQGRKHSSTEHQHKKKHGKKSSRKVVIRNINYITSNGDGEKGSATEGSLSNEEEYINGDSLKQQVEEAVGSFERRNKSSSRHHKKQHRAKHSGKLNGSTDADSNGMKGNNNWDAFQNLLLRDDDSTPDAEEKPMKFQEEYIGSQNFETGRSNEFNHEPDFSKNRAVSNDSFVVTERGFNGEGQNRVDNFKEGKDAPSLMRKNINTDEAMLFSQRNGESGSYSMSNLSGNGLESSLTKCQKEEDWFIINQSGKPGNENQNRDFSMFNGISVSSSATDSFHVEKNKKDIVTDDSFMIQARSSEDQFNSQSAADLSLVSDIVGATEFMNSTQEGSHNKTETLNSHEPDDLFMVLDRDSALEQSPAPWSMEMDYDNNISSNEANRKLSEVETDKNHPSNLEGTDTKTPGVKNGKVSRKEAKSKALNASLGKSKSDMTSRSKASPGSKTRVTKSKSEKEEENRKKKEELMIQRQKRIAERSASKKTGTKTSLTSAKKENPKIHPSNEETKKLQKPVIRNSTIERLATARVSQPKVSPSPAKSGPTKKPSLKANGVPLQKTIGKEKKKQAPKEIKSSSHKEDSKKTNGEILVGATNGQDKNEIKVSVALPMNSGTAQSVKPNNSNLGSKDNGELSKTSSEKHTTYSISEREHVHANVGQLHAYSSLPNHDLALGGNQSRGEEVSNKLSLLPGDNKPQHITEVITSPTAVFPSKPQTVSSVNSKVNQEIDESNTILPQVTEKQISTTPAPDSQVMMPEPVHFRKKWNTDEDNSKPAKGFRKLLFFGRKS